MDLNLNLGSPLCPPPLSVDLGYDLALNDLSGFDDVLLRLPSVDALHPFDEIPEPESLFEPFDLPSYNDSRPSPLEGRRTNALNSMPYSGSLMLDNETLAPTGGVTDQRELHESPQLRFQRLVDSSIRSRMARTRSSGEDSSPSSQASTDPERLMRDIRRSGRLVGTLRKHKASDKAPQAGGSADEKKAKDASASDFDCNICFEVAKEPVVTCCGHLFCWPCLYQWLHVHCDYKECPVCKGKVNESSVVPIYGRGSSAASCEQKSEEEDRQEGVKIPPRPQGNRVESLRQQLQNPFLRRSEAWLQVQEIFSELPERFWLLGREDRRSPPPPPRSIPSIPLSTAAGTSVQQTGTDADRHGFQVNARIQRIATEIRNAARTNDQNPVAFPRRDQPPAPRREQPPVITLSDDAPDPAPSPSQASTSSTMAMIEGEVAVPNSSAEPDGNRLVIRRIGMVQGEAAPGSSLPPNRSGTTMVLRRRMRTRSSGFAPEPSEQAARPRQRRRMN